MDIRRWTRLRMKILDLLKAEGEENIRIAYGTIVNDIKKYPSLTKSEACARCRKDLLRREGSYCI